MEIKFIGTLKIDTSEYWNWIKSLFPPTLSNEEVFNKWMPEARTYTYRFLNYGVIKIITPQILV